MSCTWDHYHPTSSDRFRMHLYEAHGFAQLDLAQMSKAEMSRAHGPIRKDTKCRWRA